MPKSNAENLQALAEAWGAVPWRLEEADLLRQLDMSIMHPDVEYEDTVLPDHVGETYRGHEGVMRATERWIEPFEWLKIELHQIVGEGDRLVSIHHCTAKARHMGVEIEGPVAYVWTFERGKVVHFRSYSDPQEALRAAGLADEQASGGG
jgi:ketosteroid isomerase-like protein